jgi:hypothetical protein
MCGTTLGKITDAGLLGAAKPISNLNKQREERKAVRSKTALRLVEKSKLKKQGKVREGQITKFSANVAAGAGARKAASIGR